MIRLLLRTVAMLLALAPFAAVFVLYSIYATTGVGATWQGMAALALLFVIPLLLAWGLWVWAGKAKA